LRIQKVSNVSRLKKYFFVLPLHFGDVVKALHSEAERFQKDSRHSKCFSNRRLATSLREKPIHDHTSSKFITNSSGHDEHDWKAQKQLLPSVSKADSGGMRSMLLVADESWDVVTLIYIFYTVS
jgi:hypothetical protein